MSTAISPCQAADYVNPVIGATQNVFKTMLDCSPKRSGLMLKGEHSPKHEVSAVIGITGRVVGTIVVCLSRDVALKVLDRMVGIECTEITREVCDAVGELANMIAGGAKAKLEHLELSIGLPNIVSGVDHAVYYPSNVSPICILFESEIGPFMIEVGFNNLVSNS